MDEIKIWIIHYTPLKDRKIHMIKQLDKIKANYTFVELYDKENMTNSPHYHKIRHGRKIYPARASNLLKMFHIFNEMKQSTHKYNMIMEDDCILDDNFVDDLTKSLQQLPANYHILDLNSGLDIPQFRDPPYDFKKDKYVYLQAHNPKRRYLKSSASYLVSRDFINKINQHIDNLTKRSIRLPSDKWLDKFIYNNKLNVYWTYPYIVNHGSVTNMFNSTCG